MFSQVTIIVSNITLTATLPLHKHYRAQATLSKTSEPDKPYRSATANKRSGRKVPSVSMYKHFPSAPPWSMGNYNNIEFGKTA
jgi:hypothetical protein